MKKVMELIKLWLILGEYGHFSPIDDITMFNVWLFEETT